MNVAFPSQSHADSCLALLVDRDRDSLQMYAEYLRHAAYDVDQAEDGREALAKAISRRPHVIITETRLPGIDGFRLCELLRADVSTRATPIIVVTANAYPDNLVRAQRSGADVVLTKPCLPEQLISEMRRCLEMSRALKKRAATAQLHADEQPVSSTSMPEKTRPVGTRVPLSRTFKRHSTITPPSPPPALVCPSCDTRLEYQDSHIGGVSEHHREQWDYYACPAHCGRFQYRQRTRKLRKLT
jgi:CheY-like chemotaxis protein